ncbi:hypothetical protein MKK50_15795 [Methylobacterium sp. J-043]|jgi:hypothetical protein|uniref:Uncharacterized protein n=1 Tax=Methylobacterium goesingense TaxID=243690 RepID=A0ABV2L9Q2_9HYPH|nr:MULTISPECIES: hypothetical protein [Methylobacteriaceae]MCJ2030835.1 hypothetical protein [Methylobacterium sp. J-043]KQP04888.1 hypothetical protein ASF28_18855 [Methylobacterium sp. Leaf99]KQT49070.1 hypothetical protein ASG52_08815 [Methylobacterium sp. Leaf456]UYW33837.1 hypothetical protein OKB92_07080 [Methylorubrum extorquens]GJD74522.1 hypothetical protein CFIICLFH_2756 [Methylobacterium goesingense]
MTTDAAALAKIEGWTSICGDKPEVLVHELAELGFVIMRRSEIDALADAMWQCLDDMGAQGQGVCLASKAKARVAYEPFRVDADGEEAPVDYPLEEAERTLEWIRDGLRHELIRPVTVLPWSDEAVSPLIKIDGGKA